MATCSVDEPYARGSEAESNSCDTFKELEKAGLEFDVRKVPNDMKANMDDILKKAQAELNK